MRQKADEDKGVHFGLIREETRMRRLFLFSMAVAALSFGLVVNLDPRAIAQQSAPGAGKTYVQAGTLIAVPGEPAQTRKTIIIENGRISAIRDGFVEERGGAVIDLRAKTVLPGLIDSHVHLLNETGPSQRLDVVTKSEADFAVEGYANALKNLRAGFTTVADLGAGNGDDAIFAIRDSIRAGKLTGPRILAAGSTVTPTGGHGDIPGYRDDVMEVLGRASTCNGADDCRRAVREQVRAGADVIKITATGGVLSNIAAGTEQQFFDDELVAIVETARQLGRKVTAHAHGVTGVNAALRAGVASIEHGTFLDAESIRLFKEKGAVLVPTVLAGRFVENEAKTGTWMTPAQRAKALDVGPRMLDMLRRAKTGGVTIAFGTDTGVSKHGDNAQEFGLWIEAGFTPPEALRAATIGAATHLGIAAETGSISVGKAADIIAVDGDPLRDVGVLLDVDFVMARGVVAKE